MNQQIIKLNCQSLLNQQKISVSHCSRTCLSSCLLIDQFNQIFYLMITRIDWKKFIGKLLKVKVSTFLFLFLITKNYFSLKKTNHHLPAKKHLKGWSMSPNSIQCHPWAQKLLILLILEIFFNGSRCLNQIKVLIEIYISGLFF
jgi:hypothetical protein